MIYFVGLGNPGQEYDNTRHNSGRMALEDFAKHSKFGEFTQDKKNQSLVSIGNIKKEKVTIILPETFMNKSGEAVKKYITSLAKAKSLVVVHDDLDLPLGCVKLSFNKSSAGHKGVDSIIKALKTQEFYRLRIGVAKAGAKGKIKKPKNENAVIDFIIGKFNEEEKKILKSIFPVITQTLTVFAGENKEKAVQICNSIHQ